MKKGFTLLFAALVGALVIAVGMAILNITIKQLILASAGRASQQAFFAADAGVECALYLDRGAGIPDCQLGLFGAPSIDDPAGVSICGRDGESLNVYNGSDYIQCYGKLISIERKNRVGNSVENNFYLRTSPVQPSPQGGGDHADMCFEVTVKKTLDNTGTEPSTIIESRGYNTCADSASNRFERAIRSVNK